MADNAIEKVSRAVMINPVLAYEVNEAMETILHLAVAFGHYDLVEYLMELDCGKVLLAARDI